MQVVKGCVGAAGFSIGEYTALIFAQAMTLEDGETVYATCICSYSYKCGLRWKERTKSDFATMTSH